MKYRDAFTSVMAWFVILGLCLPLCVFFAALAWRLAWSMVTGESF